MRTIRTLAAVAAVISGLAAGPVSADTIMISARASTICRIDFAGATPTTLPAGETALGSMTELCNSADGYRLVMRHPTGLTDAWLVIDGQRIALSDASETVLFDSDLPGYRQRSISIALASDLDVAGLSFSAQPKGVIY